MATSNSTPSLEEIRKELKKEIASQAAKWLIAGAVAFVSIAATGWWLYLKPKLVEIAGGVPTGVVAAFDAPEDCPAGWGTFEGAAGRTIIGTGKGQGLSERRYREEGGEESHVLKVEEMPSHTHEVVQMILDNNVDGVDSKVVQSYEHHNEPRRSGAAGGNQAHNTMQPFIALKYCKKK
jgi:hypothetical protein